MSEEHGCRSRAGEAARPRERAPASRRRQKAAIAGPTGPLSLAELQDLFQRAVIDGDDAILALVADSSREDRETLFGVYRHAYRGRLVEILRNDYAELARIAGDATFERLALDFISAHPSRTANARWFGAAFPDFLAADGNQATHPEHAEIAAFMRALNDVFDAADDPCLTLADLAGVPPERWGDLIFTPHPAVRRLDLATNAIDLWRWANEGEAAGECPSAVMLTQPERIAVYRPELTPRYRRLAYEEAMMFDQMAKGTPFAGLCEMVGTYGGADGAALRAATLLKIWIEEGMLSGPQDD